MSEPTAKEREQARTLLIIPAVCACSGEFLCGAHDVIAKALAKSRTEAFTAGKAAAELDNAFEIAAQIPFIEKMKAEAFNAAREMAAGVAKAASDRAEREATMFDAIGEPELVPSIKYWEGRGHEADALHEAIRALQPDPRMCGRSHTL